MDSWQQDWGQPDRRLFLRESWRYRARRLLKWLLQERNFWLAIAVAALYVAARMFGGAA